MHLRRNAMQRSARHARHFYNIRQCVRHYGESVSSKRWTEIKLDTLPAEQLERVEHKTYRIRQHGNTSLPLPPFLDPIVFEARTRHKTAVQPRQSDVELTDFQKELIDNPYAQALATPVRHCKYTNARVPQHFLQSFSAVLDPEADSKKLMKICAYDVFIKGEKPIHGRTVYVANNLGLVEELGKSKQWHCLVGEKMVGAAARILGKSASSIRPTKTFKWDAEAIDVVVKRLLRNVCSELAIVKSQRPELFLEEEEALKRKQDIFCYLWLDSEGLSVSTSSFKASCRLTRKTTSSAQPDRYDESSEDPKESEEQYGKDAESSGSTVSENHDKEQDFEELGEVLEEMGDLDEDDKVEQDERLSASGEAVRTEELAQLKRPDGSVTGLKQVETKTPEQSASDPVNSMQVQAEATRVQSMIGVLKHKDTVKLMHAIDRLLTFEAVEEDREHHD